MTQNKQVLNFLRTHGSITPLDAMLHINCYRLAARIHDLRGQGHNIKTVEEAHDGGTHARYELVEAQMEMFA